MTKPTLVRLTVDGGLATITLDQPPVNALDEHLVADLVTASETIRKDES